MKRIVLTIAAAIGLMAAGPAVDRAHAMPLGNGVSDAADDLSMIEQAQVYYWGGRRYCWYDNGWNGPGWYWCGRYLVPGLGWGGGVGWHGWGRGGFRGGFRGGGFRGGFRGGRGGFRGGGGGFRGGGGGFRGGGGGFRGGGGGFRGGGGGFRGGGGGFRGGGGGFRGGGGGRGAPSDVALKHSITVLGHLDSGLGFYRFSYNGSDKAYVGVMAQEVQTVMPDAVTRGSDGYLRVYYDRLGVKFQTYDRWIASGAQIPAGAIRH